MGAMSGRSGMRPILVVHGRGFMPRNLPFTAIFVDVAGAQALLLAMIALIAVNIVPTMPILFPKPVKWGLSACGNGEALLAFESWISCSEPGDYVRCRDREESADGEDSP